MAPDAAGAPLRVLLVDDSRVTRAVLSQALQKGGSYAVAFAPDGEAAKRALDGVDVLITDWMMPGTDGVALTRWLRASPRHRDVPVILMTANGVDAARTREARAAGVDVFIEKTFAPERIVAAIADARAARLPR